MGGGAHPKDFLEVLEHADHLFIREAALRGKHVDMILGIKPADAVTGGEPNAAFGGDAYRLRFQAGQAIGNGPNAEVVGTVGIDTENAGFGGKINFAPGIQGESRSLSKRIVNLGEGQLMKDSAFHVRDSARGYDPDSAGGS